MSSNEAVATIISLTVFMTATILGVIYFLVGRLESRIDHFDGRFGQLDGRFGRLESRIDHFEGRFGELEGRFDRRFGDLEGRFGHLEGRFVDLDRRIDSRFSGVEGAIQALREDVAVLKATG
jgi:hypothetical protein